MPLSTGNELFRCTEGALAYAGRSLFEEPNPPHAHSFMEIDIVLAGTGTHLSIRGPDQLQAGDVLVLRPGAWHGYDDCHQLLLHSCCFSTDLLSRELAWTREDLQLCYLLTTGPYSVQGCGALVTHLDPDALADCQEHLAAPGELRHSPVSHYRGDIIGRLTLLFSQLGQAVTQTHPALSSRTHPAIIETMRLLDAELAYRWTLTDLAGRLSLAPGYLTRLFKLATGLPPMDYLARLRTEQGAALLLHSDESVTHIGQAVGWPDQSTFARRFKAHYGLSATTYRARFAKRADRFDLWPSAAGEYL